jgi:integrase
MRIREVLGLLWGDVDLPSGMLRLKGSVTKSGRPRTVPLTEEMVSVLAGMKKERDSKAIPRLFVFHRENLPIRDIRSAWSKACVSIGLPRLLVHDLRRSAIRNMVRSGTSERVCMEVSGHRTRSVFDRYNIVDETDLRMAAGRLQSRNEAASEAGHKMGHNEDREGTRVLDE